MPTISVALPIILSAVRALIRYRGRVDDILSTSKATEGLPFRLPPAPRDPKPHYEDMLTFFKSDVGYSIVVVNGFDADLKSVEDAFANKTILPSPQISNLMNLYFEACEIDPSVVPLPDGSKAGKRGIASTGPSEEMRLAYYIVESDRLSRNSALTRLLLATADTLLETVGENSTLIISNPKTRGFIEDLIEEFAVKQDFDDYAAEDIFKSLLAATTFAALDNPDLLPNRPALKALYGAINNARKDLQTKHGDQIGLDVFNRLLTRDGLERIVNAYAKTVSNDPALVTSNDLVQKAIQAVLVELGDDTMALFKDDPEARLRVVEALIGVGAEHVDEILAKKFGDKPMAAAVLTAVNGYVKEQAETHDFFKSIAKGELLGEIYVVALSAVAEHATARESAGDMRAFVSDLIAGLASSLVDAGLTNVFSAETANKLAAASLRSLSRHPQILIGQDPYAQKVLAATFQAAGEAFDDGLDEADIEDILNVALGAAVDNVGLLELDELAEAAVLGFGSAIKTSGLKAVLSKDGRKEILLMGLATTSANPIAWGRLNEHAMIEPLVTGIFSALADGKGKGMFSSDVLVDSAARALQAASRYGRNLIEAEGVGSDDVKALLDNALTVAGDELGKTLDDEILPDFFERVLTEFLTSPFKIYDVPEDRQAAVKTALEKVFNKVKKFLEE